MSEERCPREASEASRSNSNYGASTIVRTTHGRTGEFPIKVGLHQGSGLSPFLFIEVLDVNSEEFRCELSCALLLFADDLAVVTDTEEEMVWLADWDGEQGTKSQHRKMEVMVSSRRGPKSKTAKA